MKRICMLVSCTIVALVASTSVSATTISIASNFNGTDILGNYIWYNAHLTTLPTTEGSLLFTNQSVANDDPSIATYNIADALITFVSGTGSATTTFNNSLNRWETTVYLDSSPGDPFFGGLGVLPGIELSGSNPVTWTADVAASSSLLGESFNWQWAAAAYTSFTTDFTSLEVAAIDGYNCTTGGGGTPATNVQSGTPCTYTSFVTGGARGGGGSNFTGSNSGTGSFTVDTAIVPVPAAVWLFGSGLLGLWGVARRKDV